MNPAFTEIFFWKSVVPSFGFSFTRRLLFPVAHTSAEILPLRSGTVPVGFEGADETSVIVDQVNAGETQAELCCCLVSFPSSSLLMFMRKVGWSGPRCHLWLYHLVQHDERRCSDTKSLILLTCLKMLVNYRNIKTATVNTHIDNKTTKNTWSAGGTRSLEFETNILYLVKFPSVDP